MEGTNPSGSQYQGMLALLQNHDQFQLTWWIGKDVFHGTGHFAGKMLVVNWGDKDPVIYTFGDKGVLDGEWADGSASETLEPVAVAAPGDVDLAEGIYDVEGHNPDGGDYEGTVDIEKKGKGYQLSWKVGDLSYEGSGQAGRQPPDRGLGKLDAGRLCAGRRRQFGRAVGRRQGHGNP